MTLQLAAKGLYFAPEDYKLCYVDPAERIAYFTTKPLEGKDRQWGDDWNDSPISCNAGTPYGPKPDEWVDGVPAYDVASCYYAGSFQSFYHVNGSIGDHYVCVETVNSRAFPWLFGRGVAIWAGVSTAEFVRLVESAEGACGPIGSVLEAQND